MIITDLENTDLHVDSIYGGSRLGHAGDDPLPKLLGVDSQAGFRVLGKRKSLDTLNLIVLITSFKSIEGPDHLDREWRPAFSWRYPRNPTRWQPDSPQPF